MELNLKGKTVFITGGSRGIGKAMAESFAEEGANVIITYRKPSDGTTSLIENLRSKGVKAEGFACDVGDREGMSELITNAIKEFEKIDILINNAGVVRDNLLLTMDGDDWDSVIHTNLSGVYNCIKPIARHMLRNRGGSIINLSSIAGSKPGKGHCNYAASKGGVEAMTKSLAKEFAAKNIRVNAIAPGMIETDMSEEVRKLAGDQILAEIPLKRYGKAQDIANGALFLASDVSNYMTGEILHIDGGL